MLSKLSINSSYILQEVSIIIFFVSPYCSLGIHVNVSILHVICYFLNFFNNTFIYNNTMETILTIQLRTVHYAPDRRLGID